MTNDDEWTFSAGEGGDYVARLLRGEVRDCVEEVVVPGSVVALTATAIARKQWRSETLKEAVAVTKAKYGTPLRSAVVAYVTDEYAAAGAGLAGRWQ